MGDGSAAPAAPGALVGNRYELVRPLGSGGMAQVWEGRDRLLGRAVAVKILHPHLLDDSAIVQRFRREAVAAARLVHPGIVSVYDTISDGAHEAIVMELVQGTTLRERLDSSGPLDERRVRELGREVAGALDCAHRNGIVHRDIKPGNILLTDDGTVRLADFGIAKADEDPDLTVAGTLVGTASYLAPEQVGGGRTDQRTDLYALSTVLYEAATGTLPFRAESPAATALARLHQDPVDLRTVGPSLSEQFCSAVMRNLAREPERRFQSAMDFAAALASRNDSRRSGAPQRAHLGEDLPSIGRVAPVAVDDTAEAPTVRRRQRPKRPLRSRVGRLVLALMIAGPVAVIVWLVLDERAGDPQAGPSSTVAARPIVVAGVTAFDPAGDRREHDDQAAEVLDDDPSTAWTTETYRQRDFGTKAGVGLVLRLERTSRVRSITLTGPAPWSGEVYVLDAAPQDVEDLSSATARPIDATAGDTTVDLGSPIGSYVVVWITDLGPSGADGHGVEITSIEVAGRASDGG